MGNEEVDNANSTKMQSRNKTRHHTVAFNRQVSLDLHSRLGTESACRTHPEQAGPDRPFGNLPGNAQQLMCPGPSCSLSEQGP